ncbi:MAG: fused MFS/spermidine synthase [Pseudomonadota bacterium]
MQHSKGFIAYLIITAALCGALVMVVEVLGSRVIGPFFGVSLFVWTSLITVTMVALATGYAIGGHWSDRRSSPDWLYGIIMVSGILEILIPALKGPILQMSLPLGLRWGSLTSAFLLFGPSLFLLGCVSPYVVKIAAREMHNIGRTVGSFYAISTVGSVVGTLLTGFVLIAYLGVNQIFLLTGALLIALGVVYFVFFRRNWAPVLAAIVPLLLLPHETHVTKTMPDGTRVERIVNRDSFYGNLKVVDYSYQSVHNRELLIDGLVQGGIDMSSGLSVYEYAYLLQFLPYALNPDGRNCLVIGLGAGLVPAWYKAQGVETEVVDIDPAVIEIAHSYFGFNPAIPVHVEDARYFLINTRQRYDFMVLDVFNGDTTPGHLLSVEAMRLAKQRLSADGVLAVNLVGSIKHHTLMTSSVIKTLQSVFDQVAIYPAFNASSGEGTGNIEIVAYDGPIRALQLNRISNMAMHPLAESSVRFSMQSPYILPANSEAMILTDNYNPVDFYDLWLKEQVRKIILDTTDFDILLSQRDPKPVWLLDRIQQPVLG